MNEQAQKTLAILLQKASDGIDQAVAFSQAQVPDVIHQLLVWNFTRSLIITIITLASVPLVIWGVRKQLVKHQIGEQRDHWEGKTTTRYQSTLVYDKNGDISPAIMLLAVFLVGWGAIVISVVTNMDWLQIWVAPKFYLIEYAASLMGKG